MAESIAATGNICESGQHQGMVGVNAELPS